MFASDRVRRVGLGVGCGGGGGGGVWRGGGGCCATPAMSLASNSSVKMAWASTERHTLLSLTNSTRTESGLLASLRFSCSHGVERNTGETTLLLTSNSP